MVLGKNFVGFDYSAKGSVEFKTINPLTNIENSTVFIQATEDEINRSVVLAKEAFIKFQNISFKRRADFIDEIARQIQLIDIKLLECYISESGLSGERGRIELKRTLGQLNSFARMVRENDWLEASIDTADNDRIPPKPDLRKMLVGIGPVVVFGASNFPLAYSTAGGDTVAAFASGCPVIVKAHPMHAGTGDMVAKAIITAAKITEMPEGIFSNLNSIDFEAGKQLVLHPEVKAVGFTGSISGGRSLFDLANSRPEPIPVFAEMGSVNPMIIFPDLLNENLEKWSTMIADSVMQSTGQFCTSPGLLFLIQNDDTEKFINLLSEKLLKKESTCMLHPAISEKFISNKERAKMVADLRISEKEGFLQTNFARQTILTVSAKAFLENPVLHEEVFGPNIIVVICDSTKKLESCITELKGQLTGSIIGFVEKNEHYASILFTLQLRVGRLIFDGVPTGVEVCPSMHHGGPYPASTDSRFTAVGIDSVRRFARPVAFQNCPEELLPEALRNKNITNCYRRINGKWTRSDVIGKKL